jgi:hypothetical protein
VLGLTAVLGIAGMAAAGAAVGTAVGSVHHAPAAAGQVVIAGLAFSYPTVNAAAGVMLVLAAVGLLTIAGAVRAGWRQHCAHRRFLAEVEAVEELEGHPAVTVIAGRRPEAFCAGFLRPTVYVSRGAVEALTPSELEAVLAHEYHHCHVRDPLRFACGRILAHAVFFLPVLRPLADRYADLAELRADHAAVCASAGTPQPLASALLVFDASSPGAGGASAARVDSMLGETRRWRVSWGVLIGSLVVLCAAALLIWQSSAGASADASFNLPVLSPTPCLSLVMAVPLFVCISAARLRPRAPGA